MGNNKILYFFIITSLLFSCNKNKKEDVFTKKIVDKMTYGIKFDSIFLSRKLPLPKYLTEDLEGYNWKQDDVTREAIIDLEAKGFITNNNIEKLTAFNLKLLDSLQAPCPENGVYVYFSDLGISSDKKHAVCLSRVVKFDNCIYTYFRQFLIVFKRKDEKWEVDGISLNAHYSKDTLELPNISAPYGKREWE
jgi:hypothetical protein